ncbi:MAG: hypothetical protein CMK23_10305 [Porticoccaceae bacterium]|nr:hypothetical protein [Porticoccaceae bacterium]|tara:strand:+ start:6035 stop:6715 length:681 start_codon:yes stop_codon:yes gene_type:complete
MCGAIPIAVISGVLGVAGSYMQYQQAKTNVAYQNAQQNLQYQSSMLQAQSNRMTEDVKKQMNDDAIQHANYLADLQYERDSTRITMNQMQQQEQAAQEKTARGRSYLEKRGEVAALRGLGTNAWTLIADIKRTQAAADFITNRNTAFSLAGTQSQRLDAQANRASRRGQTATYLKKTYLDPVKPLKIPKPSFGPYALGMASSVVGGFSTYGQLNAAGMQDWKLAKR